jgi:hypothetical protein
MFPLPALPLVPKLHSFFEIEQAKTFMLIFGIALLVQFFLPWGGPFGWLNFSAGTIWPLIVGAGFVTLSFVPGLADKLNPNLLFLIVAGSGTLGLLWSFAGGAGSQFFWIGGFGALGLASTCAGLFLWARNGYQQLYWTLVLSGLIGLTLSLLIPFVGGLPLVMIFTQITTGGGGFMGVMLLLAGIIGCALCLGFLFLIVLLVMNVLLKKEDAEQEQIERFGATLFIAGLAVPFVYGLISLGMFALWMHVLIISGIFLWLTIWGTVCFFEARSRGENLFDFS